MHSTSSHSLDLDHTIGEQVREQVRIAQENDRYEAEKLISLPTGDTVQVERLINHLHTEGRSTAVDVRMIEEFIEPLRRIKCHVYT